jgi:hypothetical protein
VVDAVAQGYFSLLRWRPSVTRDEARNVAVILVSEDASFGGIDSLPISSVSARLAEQGIVDSLVYELRGRFDRGDNLSLDELETLRTNLGRSLLVTEPEPVAVPNPSDTLLSLSRAYLSRRRRGPRELTKGVVLDRVVESLRKRGVSTKRGAYVDDFLFDVVVESKRATTVIEVLSFATARKDWAPIERDAGHFLYAVGRVGLPGRAVIEPPSDGDGAQASFERVLRWLKRENVPSLRPDELDEVQLSLFAGSR